MEQIVQDYRKLVLNLPEKIKKSSFKPKAFIKMLQIPSATFYNRMKFRNFTIDETEKIVKILEMEKNLEKSLADGIQDLAKNRTVEADEVFKKLN